MKRFEHPVFDFIDQFVKNENFKAFEGGGFPKAEFYSTLKVAHPIVFDQATTRRASLQAGVELDVATDMDTMDREAFKESVVEKADRVEEFSLPFANSFYLLTNSPLVVRHPPEGSDRAIMQFRPIAYLMKEVTPEKLKIFQFMRVYDSAFSGGEQPLIDWFDIDLKAKGSNFASDIVNINRLSNMISVKRIGIEKTTASRTFKSPKVGMGFTTVKYPNVIHIADKVEYEYMHGIAEGIKWDWRGFWRGHWRALYFGEDITGDHGQRVVNYDRLGKNRAGDYSVKGYTWVNEHTKGDPALAEMKVHSVVSK